MKRGNWTPDELATLETMLAAGADIHEIAARLDRSTDSVRSRRNFQRRKLESKPAASVPADTVVEFENSALKSEIEELQKRLDTYNRQASASGVECEWVDAWNGAEEWQRAENQAAKTIDKAAKRGRFKVNFPDDRPVAISCISDQHIAPGTACDFKRMREDAEMIRDTVDPIPFYACLLGDGVDNHIKIQQAVLNASSTPDTQWRLFDHYLGIFGEKILTVISGNHDAWTPSVSGVDYLSKLAASRRICYAPAEARLTVNVGRQEYKLLLRHQCGRFNSSLNQTHVVKRFWEMGEEEFDIGVVGHHHAAALECFLKRGRKHYAARPGSYQISTPYSRQYAFEPSVPTCPTFILFPNARRMIGFDDLRDAVAATQGFKS